MSDVMKILEDRIRFAAARHGVLASNVANVDTPGYRVRDLRFDEALQAETIALAATSPGHMAGTQGESGAAREVEGGAPWGDKNDVELDVEMAKLTENALSFQAAVTMLSTHIRMYKQALRRTP